MKKVIWTIIVSVAMIGLSVPIVILDGDATATVLLAVIGICAICCVIQDYNANKVNDNVIKEISESEKETTFKISTSHIKDLIAALEIQDKYADLSCPICHSHNLQIIMKTSDYNPFQKVTEESLSGICLNCKTDFRISRECKK